MDEQKIREIAQDVYWKLEEENLRQIVEGLEGLDRKIKATANELKVKFEYLNEVQMNMQDKIDEFVKFFK